MGKYSLQSKLDRFRASFIITEKIKKLSEEAKYSVERKLSAMGVDIPDGLGRDLILSWDEVVEMNNDGITFGAHSVTHPVLVNMSLEQAKWEIGQSKKDIENRIGKLVTAFSYPNGDFNLELVRIIKESGFTCAVSVLPGQLIGYRDNVYMLSRIAATEDFNKFKAMFCGLWGDVQSIIKKG